MGTAHAKKRTNVLRVWTSILFFVPFVCGSAAWMFFLLTMGAKFMDDENFLSHRGMVERNHTDRKQPVWMVAKAAEG